MAKPKPSALEFLLQLDVIGELLPKVGKDQWQTRSEEHTSELQSRLHLVCRLLLEKKKTERRIGGSSLCDQCKSVGVSRFYVFFFFNDTATTEIYTLSLHDALPISASPAAHWRR